MHLLLFVFYFALWMVLLAFLQYFLSLFSDKRENYSRDELTNYKKILVQQWNKVIGEDKQITYTGIAIAIALGFLLASMGTRLTHSALFPVLFYFLLPMLKSRFPLAEENKSEFFIRMLHHDLPVFQAFSLSVIAETFVANYFDYIDFFWALINSLIVIVLILIKVGLYRLPAGLTKDPSPPASDSKN